jgi:catalase
MSTRTWPRGWPRAWELAVEDEGAALALVGPTRGGLTDSEGERWEVAERIGGGPSVLFDAVAVVASEEGAARLAKLPAARAFVIDAHNHFKFIAHSAAATALFDAAGVGEGARDEGYIVLDAEAKAREFVHRCRELRHWPRQEAM